MVPSLSIVFMVISLLISLALPIALAIWVMRRHHSGFAPIGVGMLVFFASQILLRMPILSVMQLLPSVQAFITAYPILYILILSFSAGIFEEFGRLIGFSIMKRRRELRHGVAFGIGHGGIEAILLVGMVSISNIVTSSMINSGAMESISALTTGDMALQLEASIAALVETPSTLFLLSGFERIFAIAFHIAMSVLVLYGVRKRKIGYTLLAILFHGLLNFGAVMLAQYVSIWSSEAFMLVAAALSVLFVLKMRPKFKALDEDPPPSEAASQMIV